MDFPRLFASSLGLGCLGCKAGKLSIAELANGQASTLLVSQPVSSFDVGGRRWYLVSEQRAFRSAYCILAARAVTAQLDRESAPA